MWLLLQSLIMFAVVASDGRGWKADRLTHKLRVRCHVRVLEAIYEAQYQRARPHALRRFMGAASPGSPSQSGRETGDVLCNAYAVPLAVEVFIVRGSRES